MTARALLLPLLWGAAGICTVAQQPFYTDDTGVTKAWNFHIEMFNEFDMLQTALRPDGEGNGRVFYEAHGHSERVYAMRPMLEHVLAGVQYALGDLPADDRPSAREKK